jgi:integrase/recombinase XerC
VDRKIEEYLAYLAAVRGLSVRTVRSYREDLERFELFLASVDENVDDVLTRDLRAFAADLVTEGKAGSSVNRALSAVRGYYRYRVRFGAIPTDPSRDMESLPSSRKLPRFLFEDEANAFISGVSGDDFRSVRDRAVLELLYSTGCRVGEAAGLTLDRLDLEKGTARVMGKGSKERIVFLASPARQALAAYLPLRASRLARLGSEVRRRGPKSVARGASRDESRAGGEASKPALGRGGGAGYLFLNARGGRLTERGIEWLIAGYAERAGLRARVTPHSFRHSFATHLVGRGADIRAVQELLGHASVSTTQIYAHVDMERLRKVYDQAHPHGGRGK